MSDFSPDMQDGYRISDGPLFGMNEPKAYQFNITNMEEAALKIPQINRDTDEGLEVINQIDANINNLYQCWRGSDANANIFELSKVRDHCRVLVQIALEYSIQAYDEIKEMQTIIEQNGGKPINIEPLTILEAEIPSIRIKSSESTAELFVDTVEARNQIVSLKNTQASFVAFSNKIMQDWNYMLDIWKAGWRRGSLEYGIESFKKNLSTYNDNFENIVKVLEHAITNWES